MQLIGMYDSPFVRRVAVTLRLLNLPYEHRNWSVGKDFERIREFNPLGRVPTLVLEDGTALIDSAAILDYLDDRVGPARALLPASGPLRREALRLMSIATGAAEKGVLQVYETVFRPVEKRHEPWVGRCRQQMLSALDELQNSAAARAGGWLVGPHLTQADITVACMFGFLDEAVQAGGDHDRFAALRALRARCETLPEFRAVHAPFFAPGPPPAVA
jgi:glutathione S-transferase